MSTGGTDIFEQRLDEAMKRLQECQRQHGFDTCSVCEKFIGCDERNSYIKTVYESMSKGETGGFEF